MADMLASFVYSQISVLLQQYNRKYVLCTYVCDSDALQAKIRYEAKKKLIPPSRNGGKRPSLFKSSGSIISQRSSLIGRTIKRYSEKADADNVDDTRLGRIPSNVSDVSVRTMRPVSKHPPSIVIPIPETPENELTGDVALGDIKDLDFFMAANAKSREGKEETKSPEAAPSIKPPDMIADSALDFMAPSEVVIKPPNLSDFLGTASSPELPKKPRLLTKFKNISAKSVVDDVDTVFVKVDSHIRQAARRTRSGRLHKSRSGTVVRALQSREVESFL